MTTQHSYIKPSRDERHALSRDLNKEATFYNSKPIVTTMKRPNVPEVPTFDTPEEKNKAAKALQGATGGVPPDLTEHESAKEHERLLVVAHKEFDEAQNAGNKWAERSATLIGTWDKIKELAYYKPKTWGNFLQEEFDFSPMQESRLRDVLKRFNLLSEPEQKQLSSGNNKNVISDGKPSASVVAALSDVPKALQTEILNELKDEGEKVTAKKVKEKIKEKTPEPVAAEFKEVIQDANGVEIPENLIPTFKAMNAEAEFWEEQLTPLIKKLKKELDAFNPIYNKIDKGELTSLKRMRAGFVSHLGTPVICPKCNGAGKRCVKCTGMGLVSQFDSKNEETDEKA